MEQVSIKEVMESIREALKDGVPAEKIKQNIDAAVEAMTVVVIAVMGPDNLIQTLKAALKETMGELVDRYKEST